METPRSSDTLLTIYETTWLHILGDRNLQINIYPTYQETDSFSVLLDIPELEMDSD
jgi:hypothetical protein